MVSGISPVIKTPIEITSITDTSDNPIYQLQAGQSFKITTTGIDAGGASYSMRVYNDSAAVIALTPTSETGDAAGLTATIEVPDGTLVGEYSITVARGDGESAAAQNALTVFQPGDAVVLRNITPSSGIQSGGNEVIIELKEACDGGISDVDFNGTSATFNVSGTVITATAPASGSLGTIDVTVAGSGGTTDIIGYTYIADSAATPILTQAINKMRTLIASMSTSNGYFFDWGTTNTDDIARMTFPASYIDIDPEEENLDEREGMHTQAYLNRAVVRVRSWYRQPSSSNPSYDIDDYMVKMSDDLKKIFGINSNLDGIVSHIQYLGSVPVEDDGGDSLIPKYLESRYAITYYQDRYVPTITAP